MPKQVTRKKALFEHIRERLGRGQGAEDKKNRSFKSIKEQQKTKNFKRRRNHLIWNPVKQKDDQEERLWLLSLEQYGSRVLLAKSLTNLKLRVHIGKCPQPCKYCKYKKRKHAIVDARIEYLRGLLGLDKEGEEKELVTKENIFFEELGQATKRIF